MASAPRSPSFLCESHQRDRSDSADWVTLTHDPRSMTLSVAVKRFHTGPQMRHLHVVRQRCSKIPRVSCCRELSTRRHLCLGCHRLPITAAATATNTLPGRTPPVSAASPFSLGLTPVLGAQAPPKLSLCIATTARPSIGCRRRSLRPGHSLFTQRHSNSLARLGRTFASSPRTMTATKIDGTAIAKKIREGLHTEIAEMQKVNPRYKPSLKIIQGMSLH